MSTLPEQSLFIQQVADLIRKAAELGFHIAAGELYRPPEQQALNIKNGRSSTMSSQHLKRLAVDLNFFQDAADGSAHLVTDPDILRPLGEFWENLDPANTWGGRWHNFKDLNHFERRESLLPTVASLGAPPTQGPLGNRPRGRGLLLQNVGARCSNLRDDVESLQRLLNHSATQGLFALEEGPLKCDGAFGGKTLNAIMAYQRSVLGETTPNGRVEGDSPALLRLCAALPETLEQTLLSLLYLRAGETDIASLAGPLAQVLANRHIDTPLRQAHFLAQIGHESGELRFRSELASGEAYEGRRDLGNTQSGDGPRYKGRGLIQLTGRANYAEYGRALGRAQALLEHPEQVADDFALAIDVAAWFWARRDLNALADRDDLLTITRRINGGTNGLDDRRRLLVRAKALLAC